MSDRSRRVLFLDIDGVLNRTGFRPDASVGLRSWIEPVLARRLSRVLEQTRARVVLSSDWRVGRELGTLEAELHAGGVDCELIDVTPVLAAQPRWREIVAWLEANDVEAASIAIVDDGHDMGTLAPRFVRTTSLAGLDDVAAAALVALLSS